jgi:response regulator RpfG family c-di-GMP phosphodiesterase
MEDWKQELITFFNLYFNSFNGVTAEQKKNFNIKKDHSFRVADLCETLAIKLDWETDAINTAYFIGLFHDIGRFGQLLKYNTFNDFKSLDHAEYSAEIVESEILKTITILNKDAVLIAIKNHNKFELPKGLSETEMKFARLIRDADKLDILKVLTEYYTNRSSIPNHTLTWELPKGAAVSPAVVKEILAGKLVSKKNIVSELDVKIMQIAWVYDLNFKSSFEILVKNRFLESIYKTLPKTDSVIDIYRKVKMFVVNKFMN